MSRLNTRSLLVAIGSGALLSAGAFSPAATAEDVKETPKTDGCDEVGEGMTVPPAMQSLDVPEGAIRRAKTAMGTMLQLGASGVDCKEATKAYAEVYAEFDRLEQLTSTKRPGSGLSKLNAAAGKEAVKVDPELYALIELALDYAAVSDGAFDPTFAAMDGVWAFKGENAGKVPSAEDVESHRSKINYKKVALDAAARTVKLEEEGMRLSLGGIARGYATDRAVAILRRHGIENFLIRSKGEMYIAGDPGGKLRKVGIPDPRVEGSFAKVEVRDRALNISRDGDKFFVADGVRYHHIIDPRTGFPAHHVRSVALIAPDATAADALSTAVFVLGAEKGLKLIEARRGIEGIVVDSDNRVHVSSGVPGLELGAPATAAK